MHRKILVAIAIFSSAASFGAVRAVTPTAWDGDPNCWQMKRHNATMDIVTNGGAKVVFIGDSITHGWESAGKEQLKKYFGEGDFKMLNLGTGGDRTEHVLWRLTKGKELDGYEAKVVFVQIGTNNTGHFPRAEEPPVDTIIGIRKILRVVAEKQPRAKIVLTAIFPRGADITDACRRRNAVVNREIAKFADGKTIFWLDFNCQFLTADGRLPRELFPDLLHPAARGYEIWASAALPYAQAALAGTPLPPSRWASFVYAEDVGMSEPPALVPDSRCNTYWWLYRMFVKRSEILASDGRFDVVLFGDSITHYWEDAGKESLAALRKTYSVLDIGYSGDRTEQLLWRGENGELDGYRAKCIMLMIGTNNTWHRKDRPEDIAAGIRRILDLIARKQPDATTLLLPIFPFGDRADHPNRLNNEKVNATIRGYADGRKVRWLDFNARFVDEKGDNVKWMPDHCHPNAAAYREIWLPAILPALKEIVGR